MNFELNNEQSMAREMSAAFAEREVKPLAHDIDKEERFLAEAVEKMKKYGPFGISCLKELDGQGCDALTYIMRVERLSKVCDTMGAIVSVYASFCVDPIYKYDTKEWKEKYLVPLAPGKKIGTFGLIGPGAGIDVSDQQTRVVLDGDHYVLNGSKIFITNGGIVDTYTVFAMANKSRGVKGTSVFVAEKEPPGFSIGKKEKKVGTRGPVTTELVFKNCIAPKENLLGQEDKGFSVAMTALDGGRVDIAVQVLDTAEGTSDGTTKYVKERKRFSRPIAAFWNTQFHIADTKTRTDAAQLLAYRVAILKQAGTKFSTEAAMTKLSAVGTIMAVATECVQLFGGYGCTRKYPVGCVICDAKVAEIYKGTSKMQCMVVSNALLK